MRSILPLVDRITETSAAMAASMDKAVVKAYGARMTEDPTYDKETDPSYDSEAIFQRPEAVQALMGEAKKNLTLTGIATRTFLKSVR